MWSTIARYLVKGAVWAAGHPDEVKGMVDAVKAVKGKKAPEVVAAPAPVWVPPADAPVPTPAPPVAAPTPTRVWAGWNADNVFTESPFDLLAVETGVSKEVLMATRNQYLALMETAYRTQAARIDRKVQASSAGLFASEEFRAFLKTGVVE